MWLSLDFRNKAKNPPSSSIERLRGVRQAVIHLTRLNRAPVIINADLIEHIDANPDTVISTTSGQKYMVLETTDEVIRKVIEYRRAISRVALAE